MITPERIFLAILIIAALFAAVGGLAAMALSSRLARIEEDEHVALLTETAARTLGGRNGGE